MTSSRVPPFQMLRIVKRLIPKEGVICQLDEQDQSPFRFYIPSIIPRMGCLVACFKNRSGIQEAQALFHRSSYPRNAIFELDLEGFEDPADHPVVTDGGG